MGTLAHIHGQVDGAQRILQAIDESIGEGRLGLALEQAILLRKILEGQQVPTCVSCDSALLEDEVDTYTSWCTDCAPALAFRFEE